MFATPHLDRVRTAHGGGCNCICSLALTSIRVCVRLFLMGGDALASGGLSGRYLWRFFTALTAEKDAHEFTVENPCSG